MLNYMNYSLIVRRELLDVLQGHCIETVGVDFLFNDTATTEIYTE